MPTRHAPLQIADDTFVVQAAVGEDDSPFTVHMNSMVIRAEQPVVVDTGTPLHRDQFLDDVFSIVEPADVRWVFVSHEDADHAGNLAALVEVCPNATVVGSWFLMQRLMVSPDCPPPPRWRWVGDGETFDAGDRTLVAVRPPLYDSPTTRGLFDPSTGVYWGSDCFAAPVPQPTRRVDEIDHEAWAQGFAMFQVYNSPWASLLDAGRYADEVDALARLGIRSIASSHGPAVPESHVDKAFQLLRDVPNAVVPPQPGQPVLEQILAAMAGGAVV
jgi:flavorubredoxin